MRKQARTSRPVSFRRPRHGPQEQELAESEKLRSLLEQRDAQLAATRQQQEWTAAAAAEAERDAAAKAAALVESEERASAAEAALAALRASCEADAQKAEGRLQAAMAIAQSVPKEACRARDLQNLAKSFTKVS